MDIFSMTLEQLEAELRNYNDLNQNELELFNKGKEFIDKALDNNDYGMDRAKKALFIYAIYKIKKNSIK